MTLVLDTPESGPCTREQAFAKHLIPEATDTYAPLPNKVLVDMIYSIAADHGLVLENEQLGLDLKGQRFFGVVDIKGLDFLGGHVGLQVGFCNSGNKSMSARCCIGGKVFVCSNRAFHAYTDDYTGVAGMAVHPHYVNVERGICERIKAAFNQIEDFRAAQESFYHGLLNRRIRNNTAYATIIRAAQAGVINKTKILTIADEWNRQSKEPDGTHEWHREFKDRNAYSLFNAFTQVEKDRLAVNPVKSNISTIDLSGFFCEEFHLN
jgi:hypothetical protein